MASRDIKLLHPTLAHAFIEAKAEYMERWPKRPYPSLTATYRSPSEQRELYAQGRASPGKRVTNAQAHQSPHNFLPSYAFDVGFVKQNGQYDWSEHQFDDFNLLIQKNNVGITWGGNFRSIKDKPHWELTGWKLMRTPTGYYKLTAPYMRGDFVKEAQRALNVVGAGLQVDGVFGPKMNAALLKFQRENGETPDGIIGPKTAWLLGIEHLMLTV